MVTEIDRRIIERDTVEDQVGDKVSSTTWFEVRQEIVASSLFPSFTL